MNKNFAAQLYQNLPVTEEIKSSKSRKMGLLARGTNRQAQEAETQKSAAQRVAGYVAKIREQRRKLKNG